MLFIFEHDYITMTKQSSVTNIYYIQMVNLSLSKLFSLFSFEMMPNYFHFGEKVPTCHI